MRHAVRQQILADMLADMGIDRWRLRVSAREGVPVQVPVPSRDGPAAGEATAPAAAEIHARHPPTETPSAAADSAPAPRESSAAADQPWSALSVTLPGVLAVLDAGATRRERRLVMDVLAAAAGDWRVRAASRRFDWPPPVSGADISKAADGGRRAFQAFVNKDVTDHGVRLVLCDEALADRLPESALPSGCRRLVMPHTSVLGLDADAKRSLWRAVAAERA